jgi:hypothetical protein
MIELSDREAGDLRERLRRVGSAQAVEETIAVSASASTSVTFTHTQKVAVIDVLAQWMNEMGGVEIGEGPFKLRDALTKSCHLRPNCYSSIREGGRRVRKFGHGRFAGESCRPAGGVGPRAWARLAR